MDNQGVLVDEGPIDLDGFMWLVDVDGEQDLYWLLCYESNDRNADEEEFEKAIGLLSPAKAFIGSRKVGSEMKKLALSSRGNAELDELTITLNTAALILDSISPFFSRDENPTEFCDLGKHAVNEMKKLLQNLIFIRRDLLRSFSILNLLGKIESRKRIYRTQVQRDWNVSKGSITGWMKKGKFPKPIDPNAKRQSFWFDEVVSAMKDLGYEPKLRNHEK